MRTSTPPFIAAYAGRPSAKPVRAAAVAAAAEAEAHDAAEQAHADADPAGALGIEVLHGAPPEAAGAAGAEAAPLGAGAWAAASSLSPLSSSGAVGA